MTRRVSAFHWMLIAMFGLFVAACLFAHPVADDFDFASSARDSGLLTAWRQQYVTWNGRYASNLLALAIPLWPGALAGYRAAIACLLLATLGALYVLLRVLARDVFTRVEVFGGALVLSLLFLCQMPSLGEGIYWYTSAVTYQAAVVLAALHFACVVRSRRGRRVPMLALAIVLLVAVAGFNEVIVVMMLALYSVLVALTVAEEGRDRIAVATLLAATAACALIVIGSPGNAARSMEYPLRHQLGRSVMMTGLQTVRFLGDWVASGPLLLASVLWISHANRLTPFVARNRARVYQWLCGAGIVLVVPAAAFPPYWATGILGQHRTVNTAYFAFLALWFSAVGLWSVLGSARANAVKAVVDDCRKPLMILLLVALGLTHNTYAVESDFVSGRFAGYDREMRTREQALSACRQAARATCEIEPLRSVPDSFFVLDVVPDARDWVNVAYARYYGVAQVRGAETVNSRVRH